jgi:hypothetical protein
MAATLALLSNENKSKDADSNTIPMSLPAVADREALRQDVTTLSYPLNGVLDILLLDRERLYDAYQGLVD